MSDDRKRPEDFSRTICEGHVSMRTQLVAILLTAAVVSTAAMDRVSAQQNTTATYYDWLLQCANGEGPTARKICGMYQTTQVQGKNVTFSRVGIENPSASSPVKLIAQVPVNVSFRSPVEIQFPDASTPILSGTFDRCLPSGCFVDMEIKDDVMQKLKASEGSAKITFKDASGRPISVPLSLKGFRAAFEALEKN